MDKRIEALMKELHIENMAITYKNGTMEVVYNKDKPSLNKRQKQMIENYIKDTRVAALCIRQLKLRPNGMVLRGEAKRLSVKLNISVNSLAALFANVSMAYACQD